ncbi:hypothetical protein ZWY2020_045604 [Hordeum vulgare]|nr:hypothetical protein ZWY2020_045604 [Hordeum vulgare]
MFQTTMLPAISSDQRVEADHRPMNPPIRHFIQHHGGVSDPPQGTECPQVCSVPGYQNDLAVTNVDIMPNSIAEDNCSKYILVKDNAVDFSCKARPEQPEDICNRESATEVPTNYQVSTSQEHVTLLTDQVSSTKNPFNIDDTRSDDLFELTSGYHLEAPNVFESEQEVDSTSQTVSNQTSVADGKHDLR